MALETGTRVGPYEIVALLGSGGMGEVYRARDVRLERDVALKFLPITQSQNAVAIERFLREARAASALNHPNIVTIHDVGETDAGHYIAMELVHGRTLREVIGEDPPIKVVVHIAAQVSRALAAAHTVGIVHRDIKPENIMVRDDDYVKVLDFGLARAASESNTQSLEITRVVTEAGTILGTVPYMSPEQLRADPLSTASDIFSLGTVLYEVATGQHPFGASSGLALTVGIASEAPVAPSRVNPEVPAALEMLILDMLQKDSRLRPAAAAVAARLDTLLTGSASGAMPIMERPLVGREQHAAMLTASFEVSRRERGVVHAVAAEAGYGKTTLVEHFLRGLAHDRSCHVGRGRCSERFAGTEAYLPFLEALDGLLHGDSAGEVARTLRAIAPAWFVQLRPPASDKASGIKLASEARAGSAEQMKRQLGALLTELSREKSLVLFLDDVHWADSSTVDLIAYLADRFDALRMLLIVSYRPSDLLLARHPFIEVQRNLQSRGLWRETRLGGFSRQDLERYLASVYQHHQFPSHFISLVHSRTEGTPLFVVDLLRQLAERGVIAKQGEGWRLAESAGNLEMEMPHSIDSLIQRTIERLDDIDRRLLVVASVQGVEFDSAVVARSLDMSSEAVEERLERLEGVHSLIRLLDERELAQFTPSLRYVFVHILYQNALYATLRATRRVTLSRSVAESIERFYGDAPGAAQQLGILFETAREFSRAARYFAAASRHASQLFANKEAVTLVHRGLGLLNQLDDTPERAELELELLVQLGVPLTALHGYASPDVEQAYSRAHELCRQLGETPTLIPVLFGLNRFYIVRGRLRMALDAANQLTTMVMKAGTTRQLAATCLTTGPPLIHVGEFEEAVEQLRLGLSRYDAPQHVTDPLLFGVDTAMGGLLWLGFALWLLGRQDEAIEKNREALHIAERQGLPFPIAYGHSLSAWFHQYRGDADEVLRHADASIQISREHDFGLFLPVGLMFRGWALTALGRFGEGVTELTAALEFYRRTGAELDLPHLISLRADAHLRAGNVAEGLEAVEEALKVATANDDRCWEPELYRLKGELLLAAVTQSQDSLAESEAEATFRKAIAIAQRQNSLSLELRATVSLARLENVSGHPDVLSRLGDLAGRFPISAHSADLDAARQLLIEKQEQPKQRSS